MYNRWEMVAFAFIMMLFEFPIAWGFGVRYGWRSHAQALEGLQADAKKRRELDLAARRQAKGKPNGQAS